MAWHLLSSRYYGTSQNQNILLSFDYKYIVMNSKREVILLAGLADGDISYAAELLKPCLKQYPKVN